MNWQTAFELVSTSSIEAAPVPGSWLGWLAAAFTWLAFVANQMRRLRSLALAANLAFIGYGWSAGLWPVLALHAALAPVNLWRLCQLHRQPPHAATRREVAVASPAPARTQPALAGQPGPESRCTAAVDSPSVPGRASMRPGPWRALGEGFAQESPHTLVRRPRGQQRGCDQVRTTQRVQQAFDEPVLTTTECDITPTRGGIRAVERRTAPRAFVLHHRRTLFGKGRA